MGVYTNSDFQQKTTRFLLLLLKACDLSNAIEKDTTVIE